MVDRHVTITRYNRRTDHEFHDVYARYQEVPELRVRGNWLAEAGFTFGDRLRIQIGKGILVVTIDLSR